MKILHLEDNPTDAALIRNIITEEWPDCDVRLISTKPAYEAELQLQHCDLILSDFTLAAFSGLEALKLAREQVPDTPFIFLSVAIGEDRAIAALQAGVQDYVRKDRTKRLVAAIHRVLCESTANQERVQAERLIREQAELLNHAQVAIVITDLDGRILYWNVGAERLYGWSPAEARGKTAALLFTNEGELAKLQTAWATTKAKGEWRGELHLHNRQGAALMVEVRQTLICDGTGKAKAHLSLSSDITEWKRHEEQFLRAQRLENIGFLAVGIAHDLNNLLTPIVMSVPLLRKFVADPIGLKVLNTLNISTERGVALVRQIGAFAQGTNGDLQLVQVKHLLQEFALFVPATFPKNIHFECYIPSDLWPIKANATQIHQVVLNLCINARDAMPNGGTLRLRAEDCVLDEPAARAIEGARPGSFFVLHVEDTGTGIAPEVFAHMWEPFVTTKEAGKGTGLGLSIVRSIIRDHGGFVQVQTQTGQGTSFTVYLPAAESGAGAPALPMASVHSVRGHGELILVVDDNESIRNLIAVLLTNHGYRPLVAGDGVDALTLFAQHPNEIHLVICDIRMPKLGGPTIARLLQRTNPAVSMLFVSGLDSSSDGGTDCETEGLDVPVMTKPFMFETLLSKVHELLCIPAQIAK